MAPDRAKPTGQLPIVPVELLKRHHVHEKYDTRFRACARLLQALWRERQDLAVDRISEATFYTWRKKYAGLMPSEMLRLRQLEEENAKLKRLVADLSLDKAMLQDVVSRKL